MKIDEKFSKRGSTPIEVQPPSILSGDWYALGMRMEFATVPGVDNPRSLSMHLTPAEALDLAERLVKAARCAMEMGMPIGGPRV